MPDPVVTTETPLRTLLREHGMKYKRVADQAFPERSVRARRDLFYRIVKGQAPVIDEAQAIVAALRYLTGRSDLRLEDIWPISGAEENET